MISIQSNEMKTHFSGVLRQVEQEQEFLITKHKKTVASLVPYLPDSIGAMDPILILHTGGSSFSINKVKKEISEGFWRKKTEWLEKQLNICKIGLTPCVPRWQ